MTIRRLLLLLALTVATFAVADDIPAPAYKTAHEAIIATRAALKARDVDAAQAAYDAIAGLTPNPAQVFDAYLLQADIADARGDSDAARAVYGQVLREGGRQTADRLRGGQALAGSFLRDGQEADIVAVHEEMLALPDLTTAQTKATRISYANAHARLGATAIWTDGDYPEAIRHAQAAITIAEQNDGAGFPTQLLKRLVTHCRDQQLNAGVIAACSALLAEPKAGAPVHAWAIPYMVEAQLGARERAAAIATLEAATSSDAYTAKQRLPWTTALVALTAATAERGIDPDALTALATAVDATADEALAALSFVATCLNADGAYPQCRQVLALTDQMVTPAPANSFVCVYTDEAPLGAAGWLLSGRAKETATSARDFTPYDAKEIARLVSDITTERSAGAPEKLAPYLANTAFSMVYDAIGWHIFVLSGEADAKRIVADGTSAGALELAVQPSVDATYYQWIIDLPSGKTSSFDWNSPGPTFRPLHDFMTTTTVTRDGEMGTYIFIPWEAFYDRLPFDDDTWKFGFIRWTPGGGLTWGGRVHELSQFGDIKWQPPTADQRAEIQRTILRRAWGRYTSTSRELTLRWSDREVGDPDYFSHILQPELARLKTPGDQMSGLDEMSNEQIATLYADVVSSWMDLEYHAQDLRRAYLLESLTTILPAAH